MKIALLGNGKTGSKVLELATSEVEVFDSKNTPTFEKLIKHDVIISFLPGEAFVSLMPLLLETKKPVVTGSTGFQWPSDFDKTLQGKNVTWIHATNFSLGVVVLKQLIERLHRVDHLFKEKSLSIHEVHHTKKLDAPSGTAISMKEWLDEPCEITSERTGDVVGLHTLTLETSGEIIRLEHEAKNRTLFAEGALWAATYITKTKMEPGLHAFQKVVEKHLSL
jgi:4-hydroxy-tetrahydrodipicolinate reductase